ncbi:MAG: glutathione reductase [Candidatus Bathyarchaeota archaeon BA1]|nr:MAG: glutathione reductase [Candidatus Bathyarchaeota archaeon BA1]
MEGYKVEAIERGELTNDTGKSFITDGIFIALGVEPSALKVEKIGVKTHRQGGILVDSRQQTNVEDGYNVSGYLTGREWQPLATVKSPEDLKEAISAVNGAYENIKGK